MHLRTRYSSMTNSLRFTLLTRRAILLSFSFGFALTGGVIRADTPQEAPIGPKKVLGPIAVVAESETAFSFPARVDTGATTSSLHVEDCEVEDEASDMRENVGKKIRFKIKNAQGESEWLEREIAEISVIKTSERKEERYKVPITLDCQDVKKRVLVSLNDRSHMVYPVLLGRNFLQGDFVVDVDLAVSSPGDQESADNAEADQSPSPSSEKE